jgi:hypothetical protein
MPESYISSVAVSEQRFLAGNNVYTGDTITVNNPDPYDFDITIRLQNPQPEISRLNVAIFGESNQDAQGISYSGNFQIKRNLLNNIPNITVNGNNLTSLDIATIKNSISFNESIDQELHLNNLSINLNIIQLNASNIENFTLTIPVEDSLITLSDSASVIPFFTLDASLANPSYDNPISVTVGNDQLIIDAGPLVRTVPSLNLAKNWGNSRNITAATVNYDASISANINVSFTEDLNNVTGLQFIGTNIPAFGIPNTADYCLQISTRLYNHTASLSVDPSRYDDNTTTRRLAYRLQYGVGKLVDNQIQPAKLFDFGVYARTSCVAVFDTEKCVITCNDFSLPALSRIAFTIQNRTNRIIPSISLYIDKVNSANNYISVIDPVFGTNAYYDGFSGDMRVEEFVDNYNAILDNYPYLRNRNSEGYNEGLIITVNDIYKNAKISDVQNFQESQIPGNQYTPIRAILKPAKAGTLFSETYTYATSGNSLNNFASWFLDKFGSYDAKFTWAIPTDVRNLQINPVICNSGTVTINIFLTDLLIGSSYSITNCYIDVSSDSSVISETTTGSSKVIKFSTSTYSTISSAANYLQSRLAEIIDENWNAAFAFPSKPNIAVNVIDPNYVSYNSQSYLFFEAASLPSIQTFVYQSSTYTSVNAVSDIRSSGISLNSTFSTINMAGIKNSTITAPLNYTDTLGNLVDYINSAQNTISFIIRANLSNNNYSNFATNQLCNQ